MSQLYALHKNAEGAILSAGSFEYSHNLDSWMRGLDIRAGDKIEFGEVAARPNAEAPPKFGAASIPAAGGLDRETRRTQDRVR